MQMITQKQFLVGKLEGSSPYVAATLTKADHDVYMENIKVSFQIEQNPRRYGLGEVSVFTSIPGKKVVNFEADIPLQGSGDPDTPPKVGKYLRALGFTQQIVATGEYAPGGVIYYRDTRPIARCPMTIWGVFIGGKSDEGNEVVAEQALIVKSKGCMGDYELAFDKSGGFWMLKVRFQGAFVGIEDADATDWMGGGTFDSTVPPVLLGANLRIGDGETGHFELQANTLSIKGGNAVTLIDDIRETPSGLMGAAIPDAVTTAEVAPYLHDLNTQDIADLILNAKPVRLEAWAGDEDDLGNFIKIDAFAAQIEQGYSPGDREGFQSNPLQIKLTDADPAVLAITFGSYVGAEGWPEVLTDAT